MKGSRPLTNHEIGQILSRLDENQMRLRDRALFLLGIRTGFRISELLSLRVGDIYQNGNYFDKVTVRRENMKWQKESRTVVLHREARQAIEALVEHLIASGNGSPESFLFQSREGNNQALHRNSAYIVLRKAHEKCGLTGKLGTHCMRKTFAGRMHEKFNNDLMKTQKALGHAWITTTIHYLQVNQQEVDSAILEEAILAD